MFVVVYFLSLFQIVKDDLDKQMPKYSIVLVRKK